MKKPAMWLNVILFILFVIALILLLTGCAATKKEKEWHGNRVLAHYEEQER